MKFLHIKKVLVDNTVKNEIFTQEVLSKFDKSLIEFINEKDLSPYQSSITKGKSNLFITKYKGRFCKPCPGTSQDYICCNYHVINETTGCPIDCAYCILQSYMNSRLLTIYANYENIFSEMDELLNKYPRRLIRIGTGELTDSLALEDITGISTKLIPYFESRKNVLFELKTKTNHLEFIKKFSGELKNLVISWSVNPQELIDNIEFKSDSLSSRLHAAQFIQNRDIKIGFHFDPIIYHDNWFNNYRNLISTIFKTIDARNIAWISLGGLRFPPSLKETIQDRFPENPIIRGEQIIGVDQKLRYFKPVRLEMFKEIYSQIRLHSKEVFVYFCMESKDVWKKVMGYAPDSSNHLDYLFAKSLYERFPDMSFLEPELGYYLNLESTHNHYYQKLL